MMGPPWFEQGTDAQTTLSDLLSFDVLVSPSGATVGAAWEGHIPYQSTSDLTLKLPADVVMVEEVTVLLLLLPNTATTLTLQFAPAATGAIR